MTQPKAPDRLHERILSESMVHRILAYETTLRNAALLRLFYASGARVSELARLFWGALMDRGTHQGRPAGQITLIGKGSVTRTVLLTADTWRVLQDLKTEEGTQGFGRRVDPVFRSRKKGPLSRQQIWRIVRSAAQQAGLGTIHK